MNRMQKARVTPYAGSAELVARLRMTRKVRFTVSPRDDDDPSPTELPINPDGPEAADRILALETRIRELEEADMSERIPATYIEVQDCDLELEGALRKAYANNGPVVSLIAEFRERCLAKRNHGYLARIDTKEIEIVFAETAIMLLHPDESRRADAKERVYAILFRGDSTS